jgi:hypothetical protein
MPAFPDDVRYMTVYVEKRKRSRESKKDKESNAVVFFMLPVVT